MPTKADPSTVTVHYGDMHADAGVIGGDMKANSSYSFLVDRGAGLEVTEPTAGRETWDEVILFREDQIVAHYKRGANNDGLVVAPSGYRDWSMLGQLETALVHEPGHSANQAKSPRTAREHFSQAQSTMVKGPER